jgi:DNA-binding HxlR family transcriptional regulator
MEHCPESIRLLGDHLTLYIIYVLRHGELRFSELRRLLGNANPVTLTARLKKLEAGGIIVRKVETIDRQSVSYGLTRLGEEATGILDAYEHFAKAAEHFAEHPGEYIQCDLPLCAGTGESHRKTLASLRHLQHKTDLLFRTCADQRSDIDSAKAPDRYIRGVHTDLKLLFAQAVNRPATNLPTVTTVGNRFPHGVNDSLIILIFEQSFHSAVLNSFKSTVLNRDG